MQLKMSDVTVEIIRKDIKNMHLRVQPPDGRVVLSVPHSVSDAAIDGFVASKLAWIRRQRADVAAQMRQTQREGVTGETMCVGQAVFPRRRRRSQLFHRYCRAEC